MNQTPSGNRIHIGFFGKRNAGKSSLVNAVIGQNLAVVSEIKGTTTDPVYKSMELLPLGPVMIMDTPGIDDEGVLGELRVQKTRQVLRKTDLAVLVVDCTKGITQVEKDMLRLFQQQEIPYVLVWNKIDCGNNHFKKLHRKSRQQIGAKSVTGLLESWEVPQVYVNAASGEGVENLKEVLSKLLQPHEKERRLVSDLLMPNDIVILVVPIDGSAPKGRLILPQQQVIRDVLEAGAVALVVKDTEYKQTLDTLQIKPKLVITDSQVFEAISKDTPEDIALTSFSILMARVKGFLEIAAQGVRMLEEIKDGDRILIAEGCTHHRQCGDIGTQKLPNWIRNYTGTEPEFVFCSGTEFPEDIYAYRLVIHCGGCMLNEREIRFRMKCGKEHNVPFTNYGIAIAQMNHILDRSLYALKGKL